MLQQVMGSTTQNDVHVADEGDSDEPILVTAVDYCLLCGQIAVMYDLEGQVMKREMAEPGSEVTYQDLFDYLCRSLELKKNSKVKKDWNFYSGPFPFCVECEQMMYALAKVYQEIERLNNDIKWRMSNAEDKYIREQIYQKQDYRYLDFRKQTLGELFKGQIGRDVSGRRRSQRQSRIKIESTTSISDVKSEDIAEMQPKQKVCNNGEDDPTASAKLAKPQTFMINDSTQSASQSKNSSSTPLRRSLRVRNKKAKNQEETISGRNYAAAEVYLENVDTGSTSNPVMVKDENFVQVTQVIPTRRSARNLKRKREAEIALNDTKLNIDDIKEEIENIKLDQDDGWNWNKSDKRPKRKRGRKTKSIVENTSLPVKQETDASIVSGLRLKSELNKTQIKVGIGFPQMEDETISLGNTELYLMTPCVKDPLSGNFYYRTVQFVWIKEENAYQCSTCSVFIPSLGGFGESKLKEKFHKHYIKSHSDRFKCRLCPEWNMFQNDLELHQHFRLCHPGHLYYEPVIQSHRQRTRYRGTSNLTVGQPKKSKHFHPKPCTICLKPLDTQDEKLVEEHRLSHMNKEEKTVYIKCEETFRSVQNSRTTKIKGQFTSYEASPGCSNVTKKNTQKLLDGSIKNEIRKKRGPYRKTLERKFAGKAEAPPGWNMCAKCGELVPNGDRGMKKHILTHQPITPTLPISSFMCPDCGWETKNEEFLEVHMKRHLDENKDAKSAITITRYPKCGRCFLQEKDLKFHLKTEHQGTNEFICKFCGRVFQTRKQLAAHGIVHTGEKKHVCHICKRGFLYGFMLKNHLAAVHGERKEKTCPLTCPELDCGIVFQTKRSYQFHLRKTHGVAARIGNVSMETQNMPAQKKTLSSLPIRRSLRICNDNTHVSEKTFMAEVPRNQQS